MRKKVIPCIVVLVITMLLPGCDSGLQETSLPRVRAALRSSGAGMVRASVTVEGPGGNALSGAVVTIQDNRSVLLQLEYDSSSCTYNGLMEEYSGESSYIVEVATILSGEIIALTIPYTKLEDVPHVTVFQDALGNSVLHGQSLSSAHPIQIGWADSGAGVVYQAALRTAFRTVYSAATEARTITVPAIPPGSYFLEITAQKLYGDRYFRSSPYFSASSVAAPVVIFNVQ